MHRIVDIHAAIVDIHNSWAELTFINNFRYPQLHFLISKCHIIDIKQCVFGYPFYCLFTDIRNWNFGYPELSIVCGYPKCSIDKCTLSI